MMVERKTAVGELKAAQDVLLRIQKADARRGALARRALYLESFPEAAPARGITARIGDTLRS